MSALEHVAHEVETARLAAARVARRPRRDVAAALAAAAVRWREDATLREELPSQASLSPATVALGIDATAAALEVGPMVELVDRELGAMRPLRPWLVAHVLASNVPALAIPAIALACLAGAAVVVKSGRADRVSGPAFRRALDAVDPELAATVVTTYWPGGDALAECAVLEPADVVVATGHDETVAALAQRLGDRVIGYGGRFSVAVADRHASADRLAHGIALDVSLHDQRGCLSPVAVYVDGDPDAFAERLSEALDTAAGTLPPGPLGPGERAAHRTAVAAAEWAGARVLGGADWTVLVERDPRLRPSPGRRTVWVHRLTALPDVLPSGRVECVGAPRAAVPLEALRRLGVSRLCAPGRMQRPPLSWPRGQLAPLRTLLGLPSEPRLVVEPA